MVREKRQQALLEGFASLYEGTLPGYYGLGRLEEEIEDALVVGFGAHVPSDDPVRVQAQLLSERLVREVFAFEVRSVRDLAPGAVQRLEEARAQRQPPQESKAKAEAPKRPRASKSKAGAAKGKAKAEVPKRPRGRPKAAADAPKRPRGRPRKNAQPPAPEQPPVDERQLVIEDGPREVEGGDPPDWMAEG